MEISDLAPPTISRSAVPRSTNSENSIECQNHIKWKIWEPSLLLLALFLTLNENMDPNLYKL